MKKGIPKSLYIIVSIIIIWSVITLLTDWTKPIFVPSHIDIFKSFWNLRNNLCRAIITTLSITLSGLSVGLVTGVLMGMFMAYSKAFIEAIGPIIEFGRPIPIFALIPLFLLWFGIGMAPQILLVAVGVFTILVVGTHEAIKNMPFVYIRAAFNLGANKKTVFRTVIMPFIFPHLIGAIRVAAAASWGLDVAAEFMGVQNGLGSMMITQQIYLNTAGIISIVFIYSILAITLDRFIKLADKKLTFWTERTVIDI